MKKFDPPGAIRSGLRESGIWGRNVSGIGWFGAQEQNSTAWHKAVAGKDEPSALLPGIRRAP